jgi:predicted MPP superfamily phosphohydrolase
MTPYLWLQTLYLGLSLAATVLLWRVVGDSPRLAATATRRTAATAGLGAALAGLAVVTLRVWNDGHTTWEFVVIAFGFYAAMLWLPACAWLAMARARRFERPLAAALGVATLCGADALLFEPDRVQVVERRVECAAWPSSAPPLRVVHLSDLQTVGPNERQRRALLTIAALEPDLVVVTGDFIAGPFWDVEPALAAAREFLGSLHARLGVVVVDGHSEREVDRERLFAGLDVRWLRNEWLRLPLGDGRTISLYGVVTHEPDLAPLSEPRARGELRVVLSHVPDLSLELDGRDVDVHLAGHTHGGQVCLPFVGPPMTLSALPREFARGLFRFGDHWLEVNPGLGMEGHHAPWIRFLDRKSVV